jgi:hypothetical protein
VIGEVAIFETYSKKDGISIKCFKFSTFLGNNENDSIQNFSFWIQIPNANAMFLFYFRFRLNPSLITTPSMYDLSHLTAATALQFEW